MARSHNIRARAYGALALLSCALAVAGCARNQTQTFTPAHYTQITAEADFALFFGEVVSIDVESGGECPVGMICTGSSADYTLTIQPVEIISGNPEIALLNCTIPGSSQRPRRRLPLALSASIDSDGVWQLDCSGLR